MKKVIGIAAVGLGLALFAAPEPAHARDRIVRFSRGVKMKCRAGLKSCKFKNERPRRRRCSYTVSYVVKKYHRGKRFRTKSGTVFLRPLGRQTQTIYFGRGFIKRFTGASLVCTRR